MKGTNSSTSISLSKDCIRNEGADEDESDLEMDMVSATDSDVSFFVS